MICFLDRSFCWHTECTNEECHRNLTPRLKELSERVKLDVCYADFKTDECGYTNVPTATSPAAVPRSHRDSGGK